MIKEKNISMSEHKRIVKILEEELKRRDKIIDSLREQTSASIRSAIRQASRNQDIYSELEKLKKENEKLKQKLGIEK